MNRKWNINLIYRVICLLLFLIAIGFINNVYVLILLFCLLIPLNKRGNPLLLLMMFLTVLFILLKFINSQILVVNVLLIIDYIIVFAMNVKKSEFLVVKNILLKKKFTYKGLSKKYFKNISDDNLNNLLNCNKENKDDEHIALITERLNDKNEKDVYDKLVVNYMRFYKNQNDYYVDFGLNCETLIYIGCHLLFLILSMVI